MVIDILKEIGAARYNGGWSKQITGLDKTKNNGYSLIGDFKTIHEGLNSFNDGLYLDVDKGGSRKNHTNNVTLFSIHGSNLKILKKINDAGRDWAIQLWPVIEEELACKKNPLATFSNDELIEELKRRGV